MYLFERSLFLSPALSLALCSVCCVYFCIERVYCCALHWDSSSSSSPSSHCFFVGFACLRAHCVLCVVVLSVCSLHSITIFFGSSSFASLSRSVCVCAMFYILRFSSSSLLTTSNILFGRISLFPTLISVCDFISTVLDT